MNPFRISGENSAARTVRKDRRASHRYQMSLNVRWKVSRKRRLLGTGTGTTIDLSSRGILFASDQKLPANGSVEISIAWPVLLHDVLPLQLVIAGRVVRVLGKQVAIETVQHVFRTVRVSNDAAVQ
jgi:PilZ domain